MVAVVAAYGSRECLGVDYADQDSVRLLAVECCGPLAKLSGKEGVVTHILPVVQKFSQVPADRNQRHEPV